jgi:hypothetical protein
VQTRFSFNSIAGSKDGIVNLQSLPMSDPIPEIEHLYFFLIFKDQQLVTASAKNGYPNITTWISTFLPTQTSGGG